MASKTKSFSTMTCPVSACGLEQGGKRTWIVQYRAGAKQRRMTLGTMKTLDGGEARKRAKTALSKTHLGHDPQSEKAAARAPKPREMTLGDVVERYLPYAERKLKASTYSGIVLHLRKHWQPLHVHELQNLERRHVAAELGRIAGKQWALRREPLTRCAERSVRLGNWRRVGGCKSSHRDEQGD